MTTPPQAAFTAPGLCHNLDIEGSAHAGPVTFRPDGVQQVPLDLGEVCGRVFVLTIADEDYLVGLVDAVVCALVRLRMAHQDTPRSAA